MVKWLLDAMFVLLTNLHLLFFNYESIDRKNICNCVEA